MDNFFLFHLLTRTRAISSSPRPHHTHTHTQLHARCVRQLADLFHVPPPPAGEEPTGFSTIGSSEAIQISLLAMKTNWRDARKAAGLDTSKPNLVRLVKGRGVATTERARVNGKKLLKVVGVATCVRAFLVYLFPFLFVAPPSSRLLLPPAPYHPSFQRSAPLQCTSATRSPASSLMWRCERCPCGRRMTCKFKWRP